MERATRRRGLLWYHPRLARVVEPPARIHHRPHIAQRLELINLARALDRHRGRVQVHRDLIARLHHVAQAIYRFTGIKLARRHGVAEEDAREAPRQHDLAARRAHSDRRVLAGAATTEVAPGDHDRILAVELAFLHIARGVKGFWQAGEGVRAELLVLLGDRWHEVQVLRRDNLVGVDVI